MSPCGTALLKTLADSTLSHALFVMADLKAAINESLTDEEQANIDAGMAASSPIR
jgi:hypothetical protein